MESITREELYRLVWSEPITKIAPRYGLSDRGMGKLCARHNIPVPPRGYWARKAAGKRVSKASLPPGENVQITFERPTKEPSVLIQPEILPPEIEFERDPVNFVVVEPNAHLTHPLVRTTAAALRGQKPDRDGIIRRVDCLDIRVSSGSLTRALHIMQALIRALEQRGHSVVIKERHTQATVLGEAMNFFLRERLRRKVRGLTPDERQRRRLGLEVDPYELEPTGELSLSIDRGYGRSGPADSRSNKLEDLLNRFIEALIREAQRQKGSRADREREEQRRKEAEKQQRETRKQQLQAEAQVDLYDKLVQHWRRTEERRTFLRRLRDEIGPIDANSPLGEWLEWAESYTEVSDPLERFRNRQETIHLFFSAYHHEIRTIKAEGFKDPEPSLYGQQNPPAGIVLCDCSPGTGWLSEVMELEVPEDVVLPYETTTPGYAPRTFCIPARVLNEQVGKTPKENGRTDVGNLPSTQKA